MARNTATLKPPYGGGAVPPPLRVLDRVAGGAFAYSTRQLAGSMSTALVARRSSDNATLGVGFTGAGGFDSAAYQAFIGAGSGFNRLWADQSGHGADAAQNATDATSPALAAALGFYGTAGIEGGTQSMEAAGAPANIFNAGASIYAVANLTRPLASKANTICGKGASGWAFYVYPTDSANKLWLTYNGSTGLGYWNGDGVISANALHILEVSYQASPAALPSFGIDGVIGGIEASQSYSGTQGTDADTGLQLSNASSLGAGDAWDGFLYEVIGFPRILSAGDRATLIADMKGFYGIP